MQYYLIIEYMEQEIIDNFIEYDEKIFEQGLPDFVGNNYAVYVDKFWQMEIDYNGENNNY